VHHHGPAVGLRLAAGLLGHPGRHVLAEDQRVTQFLGGGADLGLHLLAEDAGHLALTPFHLHRAVLAERLDLRALLGDLLLDGGLFGPDRAGVLGLLAEVADGVGQLADLVLQAGHLALQLLLELDLAAILLEDLVGVDEADAVGPLGAGPDGRRLGLPGVGGEAGRRDGSGGERPQVRPDASHGDLPSVARPRRRSASVRGGRVRVSAGPVTCGPGALATPETGRYSTERRRF
jgi:hypothetical protein